MNRYLIRGGHVVTDARLGPDGLIAPGAVLTEGDRIAAIGPYADLRAKYPAAEEIGSPAHLVLPGLVNAHTHGYGMSHLQRGLLDDAYEPWCLAQDQLLPLDPYHDTLYGVARMALAGVTTAIHSHWNTESLEPYRTSVLAGLRAFDEGGVRVAFAMGVADQFHIVPGDPENFLALLPARLADRVRSGFSAAQGIRPTEYLALFDELLPYVKTEYPRASLCFGPAATLWVTDDFWRAISAKAAEHRAPIVIHIDESQYDRPYTLKAKGTSSVAYLKSLGALTERSVLIHSVWFTDADLQLVAESGSPVVHNPASNLRIRIGLAPVNAMWQAGITVAIGTDSTGMNDDDDLLQDMGLCALLHRTPSLDSFCPNHYDVLAMATINGARAARLQDEVGTLEVGKKADLTVVDMTRARTPYADPDQDPVALLIGRARGRDVDTTLVDGEIVVRGGRHTRVDLNELARRQRAYFEKTGTRNRKIGEFVRELQPYLIKYYREQFDQPARRVEPYYVLNSRCES